MQNLFETPDFERLYMDSIVYNEALKQHQAELLVNEQAYQKPSLDLSSYGIYSGVYGFVSAPSIGMELPIYLGGNDDNMALGVAHISRSEAEKKAENNRNGIITCVNAIEYVDVFQTIKDYQAFRKQIEGVFFYKYPWMMKYYQMLYPQFFPGMYADSTLNRALYKLGLTKHGASER